MAARCCLLSTYSIRRSWTPGELQCWRFVGGARTAVWCLEGWRHNLKVASTYQLFALLSKSSWWDVAKIKWRRLPTYKNKHTQAFWFCVQKFWKFNLKWINYITSVNSKVHSVNWNNCCLRWFPQNIRAIMAKIKLPKKPLSMVMFWIKVKRSYRDLSSQADPARENWTWSYPYFS